MTLTPGGVVSITKSGRKQVICVARNYIDHCKELNNAIPKRPNFFFKSPSSVIFPPDKIQLPPLAEIGTVDYETEVAVIVGKRASNVPVDDVPNHIAGVTVALDITARETQEFEKLKQLSWTLSKGLKTFCPLCPNMITISNPTDLNNIGIKMTQNGVVKQNGNTSDMIFKIPELISYLSSLIVLEEGDIVLTGTPAGIGPIKLGDHLKISILAPNGSEVSSQFEVETTQPRSEGIAFFPFIQK